MQDVAPDQFCPPHCPHATCLLLGTEPGIWLGAADAEERVAEETTDEKEDGAIELRRTTEDDGATETGVTVETDDRGLEVGGGFKDEEAGEGEPPVP